jgi:hypothetical protein
MPTKLMKGADFNGQRATNAADASANTDLVTKQQMDALVRGLSWKAAVKVATTVNGTLATAYANGQTIDGITLVTNDRILLKNQTTQTENGIYTVNASGAPTRALDADSTTELDSATVTVQQGTAGADTVWTQTTNAPTVGSSNLVWAQVGAGSGVGIAGNGLTLTGSTFDVGAGNGISVAADSVAVDSSVVVRKYAADCAATTNPQTFTHGLGSNDLTVAVWETATSALVYPDVTKGSGTVIVDWGSAPAAGDYRVVVKV